MRVYSEQHRWEGINMSETSIITGVYNIEHCASFLKAVEGIRRQTYTDFEWILCDDGSTDATWEILCHCAETDNRIRLLKNSKNEGLAASLNKCLLEAEGYYIARQDADDYSKEDRLEKQIAYLKSHPEIGVLGCQAYLFDENGVWGKENYPEVVTKRDFLFTSPYKHGAVVFRRDVLERTGGYRVAKETRRAEDYDLFMQIHTFGRGENLTEYLYYFCEDEGSRKRRKYRYRLDEAKVRYRGFKNLNLLPGGWPYVIKPLLVGLIPEQLLEKIKDLYYDRRLEKKGTKI